MPERVDTEGVMQAQIMSMTALLSPNIFCGSNCDAGVYGQRSLG